MSKYLYNNIMKRWLYGPDIIENGINGEKIRVSEYKKGLVFKEGYDDPTFMTFRIEFGDWGASVLDRSLIQDGTTTFMPNFNDYDALPIGLLNCPYEGGKNQESYWQNNANNENVFNNNKLYSAFQYLRSRNEDTRAKYLYYFVNGLYEIQHDYPFIFKKISGIGELEAFNPKDGQRLKTPAKITLECYESLNLKIRTLLEFYRKAAWDDVYQRWVLPENMREFKMIIYVFERRIFQDTKMINVNIKGGNQSHMVMSYADLNADIPVKAYECCPCEFNIQESQSWGSDYEAAWNNSNEEISKISITVKNVKTYFKNGLLDPTLARSYSANGKQIEISNDLTQKIDSIMIYDLVESIERSDENTYDTEGLTNAEAYSNLTVNGTKALFLNKNILLENEEANPALKSYIWGLSTGGTFRDNNYLQHITKARQNMDLSYIEDNEYYRGGWMFTLASGPTYNPNKSFWSNLGDNIKNILTGTRRLILISGAANITMYPNCLEDVFYWPPYAFEPILPYNNGLGQMNAQQTIKDNFYRREHRLSIKPTIKDISKNTDPHEFVNIEDEREILDPQFIEIEKERDIAEQQYNKLNAIREIPEQQYNELGAERIIPDQCFSELNTRDVPEQQYGNLKQEREIKEQQFNSINEPREIKDEQYSELKQIREIKEQQFKEFAKERTIPEQQFTTINDNKKADPELINLLLIARALPGYKDITLDDIRKIPKQDLIDLKEAEERSIPTVKADKSVITEVIKNSENSNVKILELDKDNKAIEEQALKMLKTNKMLQNFKLLDTLSEDDKEDKIQNIKGLINFTKVFTDNENKIRNAYVTSIIEKKELLKNVTKEIINKLPINDTYIIKKGDTDNNNINTVLMSQNDIEQINQNMQFLAINNNDIPQLSFQTLIQIQDGIDNAITRSEAINGLTSIVKNSVATNPNENIRKNAVKSVIKEPDKKKTEVIY